MKELQKHEIELNRIKNYVDQHTGYDISTRSRKAEVVLFRALYFKLACDTTNWSLQKIGKIVNRDHATVLHAKKYLFDELMENKYLINLYEIYRVEILSEVVPAPKTGGNNGPPPLKLTSNFVVIKISHKVEETIGRSVLFLKVC